jgi:hypothetical protein
MADLGSQLKARFIGVAMCPVKWLPISVIVDVADSGDHRVLTITVRDRLGVGLIFMPHTVNRYQTHCVATAAYLRDAIGYRLATGS